MNPDDYEPCEHIHNESEYEATLDGVDYLIVATVIEIHEPVLKDGKLTSLTSYSYEEPPQVYTAIGDTYAEIALTGEALTDWLSKYGERIAGEIANVERERWIDRDV